MVRINKRAQVGYTAVKLIMWFIFLIVILICITFFVKRYSQVSVDTKGVESYLFYQQIFYTDNGITYKDVFTGRNYPGIIDLSRFNEISLNKALSYGNENDIIAANLTIVTNDNSFTGTVIYNREWYNRWKHLTDKPGTGGATKLSRKGYVLLKKDSWLLPAILEIEVLYPNK